MGGISAASKSIQEVATIANKNWEDLTFEERIERLTQVIENQEFTINHMNAIVSDLIRHKHDDNGHLYVPNDVGARAYDAAEKRRNPLKKKAYEPSYEKEEVTNY